MRALVAEKVSGDANVLLVRNEPARRDVIAADFMAQLAAVHHTDPHRGGVPAPASVRGERTRFALLI